MVDVASLAGFPPGAFLIGAQKAATTSFADALGRHPDIALSTPKEPDFFTGNGSRGQDWYAGCFPDAPARVLLDASTSYSQRPFEVARPRAGLLVGTPGRIHALRPDARFIYLLRDPVARAHSAYWHAVRRGWETRPLRAAISPRSNYVAASSYGYQLAHYLEFFPCERFLIVAMDAFRREPERCLERAFAFLGLTPTAGTAAATARNRSFLYNRRGVALRAAVGGERNLEYVTAGLKRLLPARAYDRLAGLVTRPVPPLDEATRAFIAAQIDPALSRIEPRPGLSIVE